MVREMRNRGGRVPCILTLGVCVLVNVSPAAAQETPAGIIGRVTDASGGVLPGVSVTATSPSLQGPQVIDVTNEKGEFRLTPLPIGTYDVSYALSGFQTVRREGLRLTTGFVARADAELKLGSLEETITVSGASPVVDATSTSSATEFTKETLELTPTGRSGLVSLLAQTPGVRGNQDVGGNQFGATPQFRVFGQLGMHYDTLEGVLTASPKTAGGQGGNYYSYNSLEEVRVQTIGNGADIPTKGIALDAIVKSGGNDFHGNYFVALSGQKFQSNNVTAALQAQGITQGNPTTQRWETSGDFGGRLIRDKLWFFTSAEHRRLEQEVVNAQKPDGTAATVYTSMSYQTDKLSYQMSPSNRFVGFYQYARKKDIGGPSQFYPWDSRYDNTPIVKTGKIEYQGIKGNSLVASLQYGKWRWDGIYLGFSPGKVATTDSVTLMRSGQNIEAGNIPHEWRHHTKGNISWYRPDLFAGDHEIKTGFDHMASTVSREWISRGISKDYVLWFRSGAPDQVEIYNHPVKPVTSTNYLGIWVSDKWSLGRQLTLDLGARVANDDGFVPAQCREAGPFVPAGCIDRVQFKVWKTITPRLSMAYDVTGSGKTVIKGGWGRFDRWRQIDDIISANPYVATNSFYRWVDRNGNMDWDAGESNLDPNGSDFLRSSTRDSGVSTGQFPNPNEKQPTTDQFSASLERELIANFAIRVTGIHSINHDPYRLANVLRPYEVYNIPITRPDPGPDNRAGTADDPGTSMTYYDFPAQYAGTQFQKNMLVPGESEKFSSFEVAGNKRFANGWQMMASYSATRRNVPVPEKTSLDPNSEINAADLTWEWSGKASASYGLPFDVRVAANFEHRSGEPWARQVQFAGGQQIPTIVLRVEPIGTRRLPNTNVLDLRLEKAFALGASRKLALRLNVFNVMNASTVTGVTQRAGATFLRPTGILPARIAEFSTSIAF